MSKTIKTLSLIFLAILISGCVSTKSIMESWINKDIDEVVKNWGAPTSRMKNSNKGEAYTWITTQSNQNGIQQCKQSFTTDGYGIIKYYSYQNCPRLMRTF